MEILKRFFSNRKKQSMQSSCNRAPADTAASDITRVQQNFNKAVDEKEQVSSVPVDELINIFETYFVPNKSFYTTPGSPSFNTYFKAINMARDEMLTHLGLFIQATGWTPNQLADILERPKPGVTNMLICGLIFKMGAFAVIKSAIYCVDFSEEIPNCVALYLLLIAQQMPEERRKMMIDAGEGTDTKPLKAALDALRTLDSSWECTIY